MAKVAESPVKRGRKPAARVVDVSGSAPTARTAKTAKVEKVEKAAPSFNPYAHLETEIDGMEKKFGLTSMSISEKDARFDTGLLCLNLMMAGGLKAGGWYTFFGGEQSCKTTNATNVLGSIVRQEDFLGRAAFFDYEGSFDAAYAESMWRYAGNGRAKTVDDVFGVKDKEGNWIKQPRVRYYAPSVGEDFFNYLAKLIKVLPDVLLIDGEYYYIYENTKANQKAVAGYYDKAYFKKLNKFKVPAPNGLPQAIVLTDSYPAMLPGRMEEKDEGTDGLASQARMFSEGIKRVKGSMRRKRIVVLGINQLRSVPMAMYGPTEQEPCGQAIKFFCMSSDTMLTTAHGILTAEEYYHSEHKKLLGVNGMEQPSIFDKMGMSQIVRATTSFGNEISGKPGHRVQAIVGGGFKPEWVALKDISVMQPTWVPVKIGANVWAQKSPCIDFEFHSKCNNEIGGVALPKRGSQNLAYLIGYWVSEGCFANPGSITFNNIERDTIDHYIDCLVDVFALDRGYLEDKVRVDANGVYALAFYSVEIYGMLSFLGITKYSRQKTVPKIIRTGTREEVIAFLSAYFEGDGSICNKTISACTYSPRLAKEIQQLLFNLGIRNRIVERRVSYHKQKHLDLCYHVLMNGSNAREFCNIVPFLSEKRTKAQAQFDRGFALHDMYDGTVLPDLITRNDRALLRFNDMLRQEFLKKSKYFRTRKFTPLKWKELEGWAAGLRTSHERDKYAQHIAELKDFINYTVKNNLAWVKVEDISFFEQEQMTYDGNMPETHTIVTNGIVSHNSDARFRMSSISIPHGKGQMEEEDSLLGEGVDTYRYIKCKTYKNKLGGPQGAEMIMRIRVADANGEASGFCRVWDCWTYLKETGQISGQRNKIKFGEGMPFAGKTVSWMEFKALIDGDKELIKKGCAKLAPGKKPLRLYEWCRNQIDIGKGFELYLENTKNDKTKKAAKAKADLAGDDEE